MNDQSHNWVPKPAHLGPEYGAQFSDPSVVAAYHLRPPYADTLFERLTNLIVDGPGAVLDVGTGTGEIARNLVARSAAISRVDALDLSLGMIERGQGLPNGQHPHLRWIHGPAETTPLDPPYSLITAGASVHWMDWYTVLPRFRDALEPGAFLALSGESAQPFPWRDEIGAIINQFSTNRDYRPYAIIVELESRSLFQTLGRWESDPVRWDQPLEEYVESYHARNGLSRDRMGAAAAAFDEEMVRAIAPHLPGGIVTHPISGRVVWGLPG
jgi:SAM-dependent methyltransferase